MIEKVALAEAVERLRRGEVLVYPTETSYALGCDATNDAAVARVFAIKGRPEGKGTPLIIPADVSLDTFILTNQKINDLVAAHWPGPLNIVAKRAPQSLVSERCETDGTQSVRQSSSAVASELARLLGRPLVATSANRSGNQSLYSITDIEQEFANGVAPDAIVDVGDLPVVPASTTIKIIDDQLEIVRRGAIEVRTNL
jgi:L-threonylcarbamoyladenylate synthase